AQLFGDNAGDVGFDGEDVGHRAIVTFTPQMRAIAGVHQFDFDDQRVAAIDHAPDQDGAHAKLAPDGERVKVAAFVTKDRRARHDAQLADLREVVDDRFGDA